MWLMRFLGTGVLVASVSCNILKTPHTEGVVESELDAIKIKGASAEKDYLELLAKAKIYKDQSPDDMKKRDVLVGPKVKFSPRRILNTFKKQVIECDFQNFTRIKELLGEGISPKFYCKGTGDRKGEMIRIKYELPTWKDVDGEARSEVAATRLLWKAGFYADVVNPVTVLCKGCPEDPWYDYYARKKDAPEHNDVVRFNIAAVEVKLEGENIKWRENKEDEYKDGFALRNIVDPPDSVSKQQRSHGRALGFINAFMNNYDSKANNNKLRCVKGINKKEDTCEQAIAYTHDPGKTFSRLESWNFADRKGSIYGWEAYDAMDSSCEVKTKTKFEGLNYKINTTDLKFIQSLFKNLDQKFWEELFLVSQMGLIGVGRPNADDEKYKGLETHEAWAKLAMKKVNKLLAIKACDG